MGLPCPAAFILANPHALGQTSTSIPLAAFLRWPPLRLFWRLPLDLWWRARLESWHRITPLHRRRCRHPPRDQTKHAPQQVVRGQDARGRTTTPTRSPARSLLRRRSCPAFRADVIRLDDVLRRALDCGGPCDDPVRLWAGRRLPQHDSEHLFVLVSHYNGPNADRFCPHFRRTSSTPTLSARHPPSPVQPSPARSPAPASRCLSASSSPAWARSGRSSCMPWSRSFLRLSLSFYFGTASASVQIPSTLRAGPTLSSCVWRLQ